MNLELQPMRFHDPSLIGDLISPRVRIFADDVDEIATDHLVVIKIRITNLRASGVRFEEAREGVRFQRRDLGVYTFDVPNSVHCEVRLRTAYVLFMMLDDIKFCFLQYAFHLLPSVFHLPTSILRLLPSTFHLPPSTFHLPPTSFHLPLCTSYRLPSTIERRSSICYVLTAHFKFLSSIFYLLTSDFWYLTCDLWRLNSKCLLLTSNLWLFNCPL